MTKEEELRESLIDEITHHEDLAVMLERADRPEESSIVWEEVLADWWLSKLDEYKTELAGEVEREIGNIQPLYKLGDVVIDSKRAQDGTLLGQMSAFHRCLSLIRKT